MKYLLIMLEVADVTGAGDCFLAGFVYALTQGYDYEKVIKACSTRINRKC